MSDSSTAEDPEPLRPEKMTVQWAEHIRKSSGAMLPACESWLESVLNEMRPWRGRPLNDERSADNILIAIITRSINTYWSGLELAKVGFGQQAVMLTRSLFEDMVDAHWVTVQPDLAMKRFDQQHEHYKMLFADAAAHHPEAYADADLPAFDESLRPELSKLYGVHGSQSWTGLGMHKRVEAIEHLWETEASRKLLRFMWRIAYRDSNQNLHLTQQALAPLIRWSDATGIAVRIGPGDEDVLRALWALFYSSTQIIGLMVEHFEFNDEAERRLGDAVIAGNRAFYPEDQEPVVPGS